MRLSTGLKAALIPALLVSLAACSGDTDDERERNTGTGTSNQEVTAEPGGQPTVEPTQDSLPSAGPTSEEPLDDMTGPPGADSLYVRWVNAIACPTLDEVIAATGLQIDGFEENVSPNGTLSCSYGDAENVTGPIAQIEVEANRAPLEEPSAEELEESGVTGGVIDATQYGPTAWYVHTGARAEIGLPPVCVLGATGTTLNGFPVNVTIGVGSPEEQNPESLCSLVDAVAGLR